MAPLETINPSNLKDKLSFYDLSKEAKEFLLGHKWCKRIKEGYLDIGVEGIFAVFYFEIEPADPSIDKQLWVIVGDLPPAYIVVEDNPNGACALDAYIGEMKEWVEAAKRGESVENLIPVNVPPNKEYAKMLEERLKFLEKKILSEYKDELKDCH